MKLSSFFTVKFLFPWFTDLEKNFLIRNVISKFIPSKVIM